MHLFSIARTVLGCLVIIAVPARIAAAVPPPPNISKLGSEVFDDSRWLIDSLQLDGEDILTAPIYIAAPQSPFRSSRFYLDLGIAGVICGASFRTR